MHHGTSGPGTARPVHLEPARRLELTLWAAFLPVGPLQLEGPLAPLLLPVVQGQAPLAPWPPHRVPGHLVGGAVLRVVLRRRREIGRHAAHGHAPPASPAPEVGGVGQEAA